MNLKLVSNYEPLTLSTQSLKTLLVAPILFLERRVLTQWSVQKLVRWLAVRGVLAERLGVAKSRGE